MATYNELYGVNNQYNSDRTVTRYQPYTSQELAEKYGETYTSGADTKNTENRTAPAGTSQADETFMSDGAYAIIRQLRDEYAAAQAAGDQTAMDEAHAEAERIRAGYGYSGGADGSQFIGLGGDADGSGLSGGTDMYPQGQTGQEQSGASPATEYLQGLGTTSSVQMPASPAIEATGKYSGYTAGLKSMLEQWRSAAVEQQNNSVDYAVQKAVSELERVLEDAQPQFREQAEAVARDERQGMDNSALYAELRGDKGGIGKSQYDAIQAAAARNRLAVQQAQTQLTTDTARQIQDLRAQGEFDKADAALQISQSYLSKLMDLEQWAREYDLSAAQFETSLQKWQAEYELSLAKLQADVEQNQWNARLGVSKLLLSQ